MSAISEWLPTTRVLGLGAGQGELTTWQALNGFNQFQLGRYAEAVLRHSTTGNPCVPFYSVVLAAAIEQGRRDEAARCCKRR